VTMIRVSGLEKRFGTVQALTGIDFEVPVGTVLGLLGPNGAGKTTTVRILTTIISPDGGSASIDGIDVAADPAAVRGVIGLAGQYAAIDGNLTGYENLLLVGRLTHLPRSMSRSRATELLARFGLVDAANRPAKTYSGGMRRRLDLAAALVHEPPVLFLDEPTTGLDPASRTDLWGIVEGLVSSGTTVLLTTQYLEEADRLADQIVVIDHGTVIARGTSQELKARLGSTIVEFGMDDAAAAGQAEAALASAIDAAVEREGAEVRMAGADGAELLLAAMRALDAAGLPPSRVAVREPTLDDVFLSLTGHRTDAGMPNDTDVREVGVGTVETGGLQ
jgi:ABC-2 type transport system ATP-binding protein